MTQQHEPQAAVSAPSVERHPAGDARRTLQQSMAGVDHSGIMGMELLSAILLWTGIGYLLDRWLGTAPWLLVVGGLVGNAAGIYLIWIRSANMDAAERRAADARRAAGASAPVVTPEGGPGER